MLRHLLVMRFHVAAHSGMKFVSGYALVVAEGGSKLMFSDCDTRQQGHKAGTAFGNYILPGYIHSPGVDLDILCSLLASPAHAPAVDLTDLHRVYKVDLHFSPEGNTESDWPDLFTAVERQLGLKMQRRKVPTDTLMVDHADAEPTPN